MKSRSALSRLPKSLCHDGPAGDGAPTDPDTRPAWGSTNVSWITYQKRKASVYSHIYLAALVAALSFSGAREFSGMSAILAYTVCGIAIGLTIMGVVSKFRGRNGW